MGFPLRSRRLRRLARRRTDWRHRRRCRHASNPERVEFTHACRSGSAFRSWRRRGRETRAGSARPVPATPSSSRSPSAASAPPTTGKRETMILPVLVLWMRTTASPCCVARDNAFLDRKRPDRGGHVSAIAAIVDVGVVDRNLREGVVDIGVGAARWSDDANLRQRRYAAAHAVELPHVGSGEPITAGKWNPTARSAGRSCARNITAFDVPPRMNTAGSFFCGIDHLFRCRREC